MSALVVLQMTSKVVSDPLDGFSAGYIYKYGILLPIIASSVHLFLYGFNVLLFRIGVVVLRRRKREKVRGNRLFRFSLFSLFVLSSVSVPLGLVSDILITREAFGDVSGLGYTVEMTNVRNVLQDCRSATMSMFHLIIDSLLVFRAYVICGDWKKRYAIMLVLVCYVLDAFAAIFAVWLGEKAALVLNNHRYSFAAAKLSDFDVLLFLSVACVCLHLLINVVLTIVIARKILWRKSLGSIGRTTSKQLRNVVAFLVESCMLYLVAWIVVLAWILSRLPVPLLFESILAQVAGIAPTLLIVQANIQKEDPQSEISMDFTRANSAANLAISVEEGIVLDLVGEHDELKA